MFINRSEDLSFLNEQYNRAEASLVILYGRRRVGKTSLISEFGKDKTMLFFLATEESELINRNRFTQAAAEFTGNELLRSATFDNWEVIFSTLASYKPDTRKLIVIDEFQYIGKSNPSFPSVFQKTWESIKTLNIMVILCGSLISMMESQTLSYSGPLYGRRTGQIKLKPIPFRYYNDFYSGMSRRQLIEHYSVTGGVPKYIEVFTGAASIWSAIEKNVLSTRSFLYEEPVFLLQQEVSEIGSYFSILRAIAAGNRKLGSIAIVMEVKQTNLTKYLRTLIDLDILERQVPVTEENPDKSKRGLYRIKDNFIDFWFKFVYPERSLIETGYTKQVMDKIKEGFVSRHVSYVYEDICRQRLWELACDGKLPCQVNKVGGWWDGRTEIDIVALDAAGNDIILGECKFTNGRMDVGVFYDLLRKQEHITWNIANRHVYYALFSISGFTSQLQELAAQRGDLLLME